MRWFYLRYRIRAGRFEGIVEQRPLQCLGFIPRRMPPDLASHGYLSRYTHRVAISNRRLIAFDGRRVTFNVKDYRIKGPGRYTTMDCISSLLVLRTYALRASPSSSSQ